MQNKINFKRLYKQRKQAKQIHKLMLGAWDEIAKGKAILIQGAELDSFFKDMQMPRWRCRGDLTVGALVEAINNETI